MEKWSFRKKRLSQIIDQVMGKAGCRMPVSNPEPEVCTSAWFWNFCMLYSSNNLESPLRAAELAPGSIARGLRVDIRSKHPFRRHGKAFVSGGNDNVTHTQLSFSQADSGASSDPPPDVPNFDP